MIQGQSSGTHNIFTYNQFDQRIVYISLFSLSMNRMYILVYY